MNKYDLNILYYILICIQFLFADYPDYSTEYVDYQNQIKYEDGKEIKYRPQESNNSNSGGERGEGSGGNEEGEYDETHDY